MSTQRPNTFYSRPIGLEFLRIGFGIVLGLMLLLDAILHFDTPLQIGYYAWFSMICSVTLVFISLLLSRIAKRQEKYYQREAELHE
jgi:hypothetical protein